MNLKGQPALDVKAPVWRISAVSIHSPFWECKIAKTFGYFCLFSPKTQFISWLFANSEIVTARSFQDWLKTSFTMLEASFLTDFNKLLNTNLRKNVKHSSLNKYTR